jgi:hypothetical protein
VLGLGLRHWAECARYDDDAVSGPHGQHVASQLYGFDLHLHLQRGIAVHVHDDWTEQQMPVLSRVRLSRPSDPRGLADNAAGPQPFEAPCWRRRRGLGTVLHRTLTDYAEIERHLVDGELKGRAWVFQRAKSAPVPLAAPTDHDIRELHRTMFADLLPWAGVFRKGEYRLGVVWVSWPEVPIEMRKFWGDLCAWIEALPADPSLVEIATVVADAHHRFQRNPSVPRHEWSDGAGAGPLPVVGHLRPRSGGEQ